MAFELAALAGTVGRRVAAAFADVGALHNIGAG
jgi:hypothetical protein